MASLEATVESTKNQQVESFLKGNYQFKYNLVTNRTEIFREKEQKYTELTDYDENSIHRNLQQNGIKVGIGHLVNLLHSDFVEQFNPFEEYFYNLSEWNPDEVDYISLLAETVDTTDNELWKMCFKKWIVATTACVLEPKTTNHTVIILSGKQGIYKSTWLQNLLPNELRKYMYSGSINPNNKDTLTYLTECMLINLDELESLNRTETGELKELITKGNIRIRKAYGRNNETYPRRASFMGSVNNHQFLTDTTGSRRFLTFEALKIQKDFNSIPLERVYAQALYLFKNGFKFWLNEEETIEVTQSNEQFQVTSPIEELLLENFEYVESHKAKIFMTATDISIYLSKQCGNRISINAITLGKVLRKNDFIPVKKDKSVAKYPVRIKTEFDLSQVAVPDTKII